MSETMTIDEATTEDVKDISMLPIEYDESIKSSNIQIKASREERKYASHTPRTKIEIIVEESNQVFTDVIMLKSNIKPKTFKKFMKLNESLQQNVDDEQNKVIMEKNDFFQVFEMLYDIIEPIIDEHGTNIPVTKEWFDDIDWEIKTSLLEVVMKYFENVIDENEKK